MTARNAPVSYVRSRFPAVVPSARAAAAWRRLLHDDEARRTLELPGRLLSGYFRERGRSTLGRIVAPANLAAARCETILVVGPAAAMRDARRLLDACAHPFHNLLSAGGRAGRARVVLVDAADDNDLLHAALDLVRRACDGTALHDRWALAVVGPADGEPDPRRAAAVARCAAPLVQALAEAAGAEDLAERLFVQAADGEIARTLVSAGTPFTEMPILPADCPVSGPALLAATAVGVDTVSLLKGSVWFWESAKGQPAAEGPVVQLAEALRTGTRVAAWHHALSPPAELLVQLLPEPADVLRIYGEADRTRLHASGSPSVIHLWCEDPRRDRFRPDLAAVLAEEHAKFAPAAEIRLTRLHDIGMGELYEWFAAVKVLKAVAAEETPS